MAISYVPIVVYGLPLIFKATQSTTIRPIQAHAHTCGKKRSRITIRKVSRYSGWTKQSQNILFTISIITDIILVLMSLLVTFIRWNMHERSTLVWRRKGRKTLSILYAVRGLEARSMAL